MPDVDFGYFLNRKYALLQQQADAASQNANTAQMTGAAGAKLDTTRATWLPRQAKSEIAQAGAQTNLIGEQAKIIGPESIARRNQMQADTDFTGTQNKVLTRTSLTPLRSIFGADIAPPRLSPTTQGQWWSQPSAGYGSASWLDRQNGL